MEMGFEVLLEEGRRRRKWMRGSYRAQGSTERKLE